MNELNFGFFYRNQSQKSQPLEDYFWRYVVCVVFVLDSDAL